MPHSHSGEQRKTKGDDMWDRGHNCQVARLDNVSRDVWRKAPRPRPQPKIPSSSSIQSTGANSPVFLPAPARLPPATPARAGRPVRRPPHSLTQLQLESSHDFLSFPFLRRRQGDLHCALFVERRALRRATNIRQGFALIIMANENAEKDHGIDEGPSASQDPENKLRHNFRLGDITWVKLIGSSWWPAQVIDESCVASKPKKEDKHDCLVRLYGTCQYLYVDPWKSNSEFEMMLRQENKSAMEAFREVLEKELSCDNSPTDYDEEAVNSKGGSTKGTSKKNSSRKVRKQEGLKHNEEEDQGVGSTETTGVAARKRKGGHLRRSSSTYDAIDKASSEGSAEGLRRKRQRHGAQSASVDKSEGLRRSARSDAKQYLDAAEDSSEPLTDMHAGEGATEASMLDGTSAPHTEIKAMVRDILFKDIIDREHDAEMAFVDEVINGICGATEDITSGGAAASMKSGQGVKQNGSGVEGESSNIRHRRGDEATSPETKKGNTDTTRGSSGEDTGGAT